MALYFPIISAFFFCLFLFKLAEISSVKSCMAKYFTQIYLQRSRACRKSNSSSVCDREPTGASDASSLCRVCTQCSVSSHFCLTVSNGSSSQQSPLTQRHSESGSASRGEGVLHTRSLTAYHHFLFLFLLHLLLLFVCWSFILIYDRKK